MKKSTILPVIILIAVLAVVAVSFSLKTQNGAFDLNDKFIQEAIEYYELSKASEPMQISTPEYLEKYGNEKKLCQSAHEIWRDMYGDDAAFQKPYTVLYDGQNEAWLIKGRLRHTIFSSERYAYMVVNGADGKLMALWADRN